MKKINKILPQNIQDIRFLVNMNKVVGAKVMDKFGVNRDIDTGTDPEDVWEYGGKYTFASFDILLIKNEVLET